MSYIVSIRRGDDEPISPAEVLKAIGFSPDLTIDEAVSSEDEILFYWSNDPSETPFGLIFTQGTVDSTTTPSNAVLQRMQLLARDLDARLIGEEGEDLTDIDVPDAEVTPGGLWGCIAMVAAIVVLVMWWLS